MTFRLAIGSFLFACLSSCAAGNPAAVLPNPSAIPPVQETSKPPLPSAISAVASETATPTSQPSSTPVAVERPQYRIRAALDTARTKGASDETMALTVHEEAAYTNRSGDAIQELVLQLEPSWRWDLFQLQGISCDRSSPENPPMVRDGRLHIPLRAPLQPGEGVSLTLDYRRLVTKENTTLGWNDYQIVLGDWYAFFPLYQEGTGWLAHPPGKDGEYLTYPYADFDIVFDATGGSGYQIAASGIPDTDTPPWHFQFTGRSFAIALTTQSPFRRTAGPVEILAYAQPKYEAQGNAVVLTTAQALALYAERFGEYPHARLTVLESELPDGMEFDGLVFLNPALFPYYTGDAKDYLTMITAHETAHQWWYGRVGNDQALDPWLDEAFATYSELLFYEKYYPALADWWWYNRVTRYPSDQCVDGSIYDFDGFRPYVNAVYLRGATMLDAVRQRMGSPAFLDSLRDIQTADRGGFDTPADIFAA
jgi:hypothetical protein